MGAGNSTLSAEAEAFAEKYNALPDDVHDMVEALCEKDSLALLKPNGSAPQPFPPSLVGVTIQLDHGMASAALAAVPKLQRKHYMLIPKSLSELDFFISFFSHLTAIVNVRAAAHAPTALAPCARGGRRLARCLAPARARAPGARSRSNVHSSRRPAAFLF